ncbi:MBL fold metallo-hydrolase [Aureibaculum sp. A20]|uniref:MBL fold metallo-hydrolase n=1 Tax=Aureibaculum flavum TaxID=2795986 RepID=A0ABS0WRW4_9FLAO|nr:MBL fold metallo-hydrolase [Aureibaculum flavum]MBJ2174725.1 MBL fold metallo-hydrolase [Aureibaculum flavum]
MKIKQFEYKPLSHFSYAIISDGEMAIVDPERDPMQYYEFAYQNKAKIIAVIETHPHADFVSSHLQIHKETGANIYNSKKLGADYPHISFDDGIRINIGKATLTAMNTPGHSPDSISIVADDGDKKVLFTGDTLFIGDVGRPDLREKAGNMTAKRKELAEAMYETMLHKFTNLPNDTLVYPAHGAGSLCGKNLSDAASSTLGNERMANWAFQEQTKEQFVTTLLESQPFIPSYFGYNVMLNKRGAKNLRKSIAKVSFKMNTTAKGLLVDVRASADYKKGHLKGSLNIEDTSEDSKFETWLGAIIAPKEKFSLVIEKPQDLDMILQRVAKIGYEKQLKKVITLAKENLIADKPLNLQDFKAHPDKYTIVDIRNMSEINEGSFFENALPLPLNELRTTAKTIPTDKPIVVHCAGGYRSAAGSSIIEKLLKDVTVYDLSDDVKEFNQ